MANIKDYEDWRELFIAEQKGKNPEEMIYQPVPEISILPYLDHKEITGPSFTHKDSKITHSFVVDGDSVIWISDFSEQLKPFDINTIYGVLNDKAERKELTSLRSLNPRNFVNSLPGDDDIPLILDLRNKSILPTMKESINKDQFQRFWIIPGDDFLWNVAFIRGIRKYIANSRDKDLFSGDILVYLPLKESNQADNESQLIPLSNQLLSMMVSGLIHFIWDIRNARKWQQRNLSTLMNVPEIMDREGKILSTENPLQGSTFFEELSDKVFDYFQK